MLEINNMQKLNNIAVHHSGGVANNPYASSLHLTPEKISNYHRQRWSDYNPSMLVLDDRFRWAGYNDIYDPKTRTFTHCRALGEETMAQFGHNFDTYSLCIIGNYMVNPATGRSVDPMTKEIEDDVSEYLLNLIQKKYENFIVKPGTVLNFSVKNTGPHRMFQQTNCYGTSLSDKWIQDLLQERKYPAEALALSSKAKLYKQLSDLYLQIMRLKGYTIPKELLGGPGEKACGGYIH